ncbi:MAG: hypothetical protein MJD61_04325 [Proteobacteria bacterium]|nr:hypothetical protein [Pseudomonadota bacterium]
MTLMSVEDAARCIKEFESDSLTDRLSELEYKFSGLSKKDVQTLCDAQNLNTNLLKAAYEIKSLAGQINVVIHAAGILTALPKILSGDEKVEYLSLGAGNTGRAFDLETDKRIAEFKFINWRGGPESIRQNSLFKDFFELAEAETRKERYLYVLGLKYPLKFFRGRRNLKSVMSKNNALAQSFQNKYGDRFSVVQEYFEVTKHKVHLVDLIPIVPALAGMPDTE